MTHYAALAGLGGFLPPRQVTNGELAATLDTSEEWITSRTGIRTRHWAGPGVATSDLAVEAGHRALKSANLPLAPGAVDAVILATTTPDHPCPATAPQVAARLGLGTVAAYDIAAVCSGFVYALATASAQIVAGQARRVLVIGAETYSTILDPADRTTSVIFGDGAGAVVLHAVPEADRPGVLLGVDLGSDGSRADLILVPAGGSRQRSTLGEPDPRDRYFTMQGTKVFAEAVTRMGESASLVLARIGWPRDSIDHLVGHQANIRILRALAGWLGLPEERAVVNVDRVGNTSAASIPLALCDAAANGTLTPGSRVLLTAFGGGLTWGAAALIWPDLNAA
ncbi:3-oxoacyl-[acyl-carrier-protein] synthase III [Asanoa ferruginea]|uniref:Beta-ketoacyl-[acyl-carrier-protein] synthase III n=1 Tax=Asanoa ferruginea TaxID=53367 RepID=A0A3D9ZUB3_9ACTN|nr:beta-ketoacyl-ACP synthase III [Asanoa ferruginea]REG00977.1 3-oxoacyl-[acyl-carrier-protein] synthase III [Asanoa ferruginea]GIF47577.1 3-oxoacyl-[acyl-carrier-protein] synthase 3 protein 5 [Asanoa ferruginea]